MGNVIDGKRKRVFDIVDAVYLLFTFETRQHYTTMCLYVWVSDVVSLPGEEEDGDEEEPAEVLFCTF